MSDYDNWKCDDSAYRQDAPDDPGCPADTTGNPIDCTYGGEHGRRDCSSRDCFMCYSCDKRDESLRAKVATQAGEIAILKRSASEQAARFWSAVDETEALTKERDHLLTMANEQGYPCPLCGACAKPVECALELIGERDSARAQVAALTAERDAARAHLDTMIAQDARQSAEVTRLRAALEELRDYYGNNTVAERIIDAALAPEGKAKP